VLQVINALSFVGYFAYNAVLMSFDLPGNFNGDQEGSNSRATMNLLISPSAYAFSIWGLIYSLMIIYVTYQTLPDDWIAWMGLTRNDDLLYENGIGYIFLINMIFSCGWWTFWVLDKPWGYILSDIMIIGMLATAAMMMQVATTKTTNWVEWLSMRGTFSLYAGWLTAATILNTTIVLRSYGVDQTSLASIGITEEQVTIAVLWVAFAIYNTNSYITWNPLYGSVFIWVIIAIYYTQITTLSSQYTALMNNCIAIAILHGLSMVAEWSYTGTTTYYDITTDASTSGGIFYGM
jgi:benzodiazapine receptor